MRHYVKAHFDLESEVRIRHFERRLEVYGKAHDFAWASYQSGAQPPTVELARQ